MLRVLMLDLGDTLVSSSATLPHVPDALDVIDGFVTLDDMDLISCLVSDYHLADPTDSQIEIERLFGEYLALLDGFKLREYFEPANQRVTLSTHAGVHKPDRRVFQLALDRLGTDASLSESLFVTENIQHLNVCRGFDMSTLQFGAEGDFDDWSEGPLRIAWLMGSDVQTNISSAVQFYVETQLHLTSVRSTTIATTGSYQVHGKMWHTLSDPSLGELVGVHVELPESVSVELDQNGRVGRITTQGPTLESIREATHFVRSLQDNQSIGINANALDPGITHIIEQTTNGQRRLMRKRFSQR